MRVYEIILSYDNGNRDYGYTNGLVFQPVNDEILNKFSSKRDELTGYKYKKFNIDEFKGLLSLHPQRQRESPQRAKRKRIRHLPTRKSLTGKSRCLKSTRLLQSLRRMF